MLDSVSMDKHRDLGKWSAWMRAGNHRPDTIAQRVYHVGRVLRELRTDPWRITTDQLVDWLGSKDWKPNTLRSYRASLIAFYTTFGDIMSADMLVDLLKRNAQKGLAAAE